MKLKEFNALTPAQRVTLALAPLQEYHVPNVMKKINAIRAMKTKIDHNLKIHRRVQLEHDVRLERRDREAKFRYDNANGQKPLASLGSLIAKGQLHSRLGYIQIGAWRVFAREVGAWNNDRYSKSWHKSHGGVWEVERREVVAIRINQFGNFEEKTVQLDGWRGNWMLNSLLELGLLERQAGLKSVRLHEAFDVALEKTTLGYSVFKRTLAGEFVGYSLVAPTGMTYHATTIKAAFAGLRQKLKAVEISKTHKINWDFCKKLGFCDAGIKQFASTFGLAIKGQYSPEQIEVAIKTNVGAAAPFEMELRKLAQALNYTPSL